MGEHMAFKYNVNLIKEQVERRRRADKLIRLCAFLLLLFAVMLFVTMVIYQARQIPLLRIARQAQHISQMIERMGIDPDRVGDVLAANRKFEARFVGLSGSMRSAVPWVDTLNAITSASLDNGLILERVESSVRGGRIVLNIEGVSRFDNPVNRIHDFALMLENMEFFHSGRIVAINSGDIIGAGGEKIDVMRFKLEVLFRHPLDGHVAPGEEGGT